MKTVIEIKDLAFSYGNVRALGGVSMTVGEGEMFGLIGPDGAGKSTMIKVLCGILKGYRGEVRELGKGLQTHGDEIKSRLGYLSQDFSLYSDLTVEENMAFFAEIHQIKDFSHRRQELLSFTRMAPFGNRKAGALSGGMKKKLALACTLIHAPSIIFLDEPTNGVDPVSRREFWEILSELLNTGVTVFMTTPYMDEAERCSRVALLDKGELLTVDHPSALRSRFPYAVFELTPDGKRARSLLEKWTLIRDVQAFGDRLHLYILKDEAPSAQVLNTRLQEQKVSGRGGRYLSPSLEDVFISYLNKGGEK
ncbi:MAG TPA: ABC transporter ATP-binding protein [Candidatus Mcinerneyibacteriales bacterium]|mgnify:CR=1 FL=1|nr:ABC transporter ATP-binding protein [Candidatus Mcinerneyibacteriales bacterium]